MEKPGNAKVKQRDGTICIATAKNAGETSCKGIVNHRQAEELH